MIFLALLGLISCVDQAIGHNFTVEEIHAWKFPEEFYQLFPYYLSGYDYDESPVWFCPTGTWDIRSMVERGPEAIELCKKYTLQAYQRLVDSGAKSPLGAIGIVDMDGFTARQATHPGTLLLWIWAFRELGYYVKYKAIKIGIIVNANFLFQRVFDLGAPLLGELRSLVEMYGTNQDKWKPRMLKLAPMDQLLEVLGGTKKLESAQRFG